MIALVAPSAFTFFAALAGERDYSTYTFADYKAELGKSYEPSEDARRAIIFAENLELVKKHNSDPRKTWFAAAHSPFADWTNTEFRALRTGTQPPERAPLGAGPVRSPYSAHKDIPSSIDWRDTTGVVTAVKDQGGCGSCWAFSAVETFESHLAITTGEAAPILSEQQVVSCSPNPQQCGGSGGCDGSTQPLAFNYTMTAGLTLEADYKYMGRTGTCDPSKVKPVAKNAGFVSLAKNNYTALVEALTLGPVAISVAAGSIGWQLYGGGVYNGKGALGSCGFVMDHGIQLVGYGNSGDALDKMAPAMDYWTVRNSWGAFWGEKGFMRLQRFGEGKEPCGEDKNPGDGDACKGDTDPVEYCGLCAILSSSSYPTGVQKV